MKRGKTSSDFSKRILFCALCTLSGAGVMASPLNGTLSDAEGNPIYVFVAEDGKQYIDAYGGTNYAVERRSFDPAKDYLRPIPSSAIAANPALGQNPGWE